MKVFKGITKALPRNRVYRSKPLYIIEKDSPANIAQNIINFALEKLEQGKPLYTFYSLKTERLRGGASGGWGRAFLSEVKKHLDAKGFPYKHRPNRGGTAHHANIRIVLRDIATWHWRRQWGTSPHPPMRYDHGKVDKAIKQVLREDGGYLHGGIVADKLGFKERGRRMIIKRLEILAAQHDIQQLDGCGITLYHLGES